MAEKKIPERGIPVDLHLDARASEPVQVTEGVWLPPEAEVVVYLKDDGLAVTLGLVLEDGAMMVDSVRVKRWAGTPPVTSSILRRLDLPQIVEYVVSVLQETATARANTREPASVIGRTDVPINRRPYRRMTDEHLREVAGYWREARAAGKSTVAYVAEQMFTGERNASRWITEAKRRGLITEDGQ